jgi:hypothetical protein
MRYWSAAAPEEEPETGYSSIGGMLPYWVLPQGVFQATSDPKPGLPASHLHLISRLPGLSSTPSQGFIPT